MLEEEQNIPTEESTSPEPCDGEESQEDKQIGNDFNDTVGAVIQGNHTIVHMGLGYAEIKNIAKDVLSSNLKEMMKGALSDTSQSSDLSGLLKQSFAETIQAQREAAADQGKKAASVLPDILSKPKEIEQWYYALAEEKQFTVQAVALLHGGRVKEIDTVREELYKSVRAQREARSVIIQANAFAADGADSATHIASTNRLMSSSQLYEDTYTEFRASSGIERVYWQDADGYGHSLFHLHILRFLAREATRGGWGQNGEIFLRVAQEWAETMSGDAYWRAAYALGVIWRSQDREHLQKLANTWAVLATIRDWRRTAALLEGAYDLEQSESSQQQESSQQDVLPKSQVLPIVEQWVTRAYTYTNTNISVGCAAAYCYGMIGKKSPELALKGLDNLLAFPPKKIGDITLGIPISIFIAILSNYITFIWDNHLRLLLCHMVERVEVFSHQRYKPNRSAFEQYKLQREAGLETIFNTLFFIITTAMAVAGDMPGIAYSVTAPLTEPITLLQDGRDTILAGILTTDVTSWRKEIVTLLCAAIIEKRHQLAFHCLQQWVVTVSCQPDDVLKPLCRAFVRLLNDLDKTIGQWSQDLADAGFLKQEARQKYRKFITDNSDIQTLIQKVK